MDTSPWTHTTVLLNEAIEALLNKPQDGPEADVHRGFGREDLAARLARAGFRDPRFSTPFTIDRDGRSYPAFLVLAERAPGA